MKSLLFSLFVVVTEIILLLSMSDDCGSGSSGDGGCIDSLHFERLTFSARNIIVVEWFRFSVGCACDDDGADNEWQW